MLGAFDKHTSLMYFYHDSDKIYVRHCKKGKETWLVISTQAQLDAIMDLLADKNAP